MSKREILVELLRHYRDAESTLVRSEAGSGGHVPLMPQAWNASYRELERCLHVMSWERPKQTRQLLARYVDPTISRRKLIGRRLKDGSVQLANLPPHSEVRSYAQLPERGHANEWDVILATWPQWVRATVVDSALSHLETLFVGDAWLPVEMLEAA